MTPSQRREYEALYYSRIGRMPDEAVLDVIHELAERAALKEKDKYLQWQRKTDVSSSNSPTNSTKNDANI